MYSIALRRFTLNHDLRRSTPALYLLFLSRIFHHALVEYIILRLEDLRFHEIFFSFLLSLIDIIQFLISELLASSLVIYYRLNVYKHIFREHTVVPVAAECLNINSLISVLILSFAYLHSCNLDRARPLVR